MTENEGAASAGDPDFPIETPAVSTERPGEVSRPGAAATSGVRLLLHDGYCADPVIRPALLPIDRSRWPHLC
jgi:hypothetical protein